MQNLLSRENVTESIENSSEIEPATTSLSQSANHDINYDINYGITKTIRGKNRKVEQPQNHNNHNNQNNIKTVNDPIFEQMIQSSGQLQRAHGEDMSMSMGTGTGMLHRPPRDTLSELVFAGNTERLVAKLQEKDITPNVRDESGSTSSWTPLYWSVKLGDMQMARILLTHGASINIVVNDFDECCGTVLDLATLRGDDAMESLLREFAEKEDVNLGQSFKAIRTKLRGKAPAFNFRYYGKKKA